MKILSKKSIILFIVLFLLTMSVPVAVYFVSTPGGTVDTRKSASVPSGSVVVGLTPQSKTLAVGESTRVGITMNTKGTPISTIKILVSFPVTDANPELEASDITTNLDWCTYKNVAKEGGAYKIYLVCVVSGTLQQTGYANTSDTQIASFNVTAKSAPATNPIVLKFTADKTVVTKKADGMDSAAIPESVASITISSGTDDTASPTPTPTPTPTPSPTPTVSPSPTPGSGTGSSPTPTPTATPRSGGSSGSATGTTGKTLSITNVKNGQVLRTSTPTFYGKAAPNAAVSLTIQSNPQYATVNADSRGNWSYAQTTALETGNHSITAQAVNASGVSETVTVSFSVGTPVTAGNGFINALMLFSGMAMLASGLYLYRKFSLVEQSV